jgi:hypothetical protein
MLPVIEKLLVLQDRDRKILRLKAELAHVDPERKSLQTRGAAAQAQLDAAKLRVKQLETERKKLELEVESLKQKIEKYSVQQFQTKKNEEYKALGLEIDNAKAAIFKMDDQQIELMEQIEAAQKDVASAAQQADALKKEVESKLQVIADREVNLKKDLAELQSNRGDLAGTVDESTRNRYERLLKAKGENVVVGIEHGVCGGCHMRFPPHVVLACKAAQELVTCPNCGRILYYTRDMDMAVAD